MSRIDLAGQRVLLTGASSGIGRELALCLASRGARLAVAARRADLLDQLAGQLGPGVVAVIRADLSVPGAADELAARAVQELGTVDVLVNNAGAGMGGLQWNVGDGPAARAIFETNLWSPLALTKALIPAMRRRGSGAVVNVTSIAQVLTLWMLGHYAASKAALALATETLRLELTGSGVHVMEAVVGPTNTAVQGESRLIPGAAEALAAARLGEPQQLAERITRALERGRPRLVYPGTFRLLYSFPAAARIYMPFLAARLRRQGKLNLEDPRVMSGGSMGDPAAREARELWLRERAGGLTTVGAPRPRPGG
jgi:short-subunit dehydrogenase